MQDQEHAIDPEDYVNCPYDDQVVTRKRLHTHLEKCRKNYPHLAKEKAKCPFEARHVIPQIEFDLHLETCPSRSTLYTHIFSTGETSDIVEKILENTNAPIVVPCDESWDIASPTVSANVLHNIEDTALQRGTLRNHQNIKPSERKAKREEDRMKLLQRLNAEDQAKEDKKNWMPSTPAVSTSSVAASNRKGASSVYDAPPRSSAMSVVSESSLATALDETTNRLQEFQLVTKRGRGRAVSSPSTVSSSNSLAGVGRGRRLNN